MKEYILTYWWFGRAGQLPPGLTGTPPPGIVGGRTGVAKVAASDVPMAIDKFRAAVGDTARKGDFAVLSALELPGVTIADRSVFVDGPQISRCLVDDIDPSSAAAEDLALDAGIASRPDQWIVTGTIAGDDVRFVQLVTGRGVEEAVRKVLVWLKQVHGIDDETAEIWSVALRGAGDKFRVYQGTATPDRGSISTTGRSWLEGQYEELPFHGATKLRPPGPSVPKADLDVIEAHRRRLGMGPLPHDAGYSDQELRDMAQSIRARGRMSNPAQRRLKARLKR